MKWKHREEIRKRFFENSTNKIYISVILAEVKKFTPLSHLQQVQEDLEKFYRKIGFTFWRYSHSYYIPKTPIIVDHSATIWVEMARLEIIGTVPTNYIMRVHVNFINGRRGIYLYYKS